MNGITSRHLAQASWTILSAESQDNAEETAEPAFMDMPREIMRKIFDFAGGPPPGISRELQEASQTHKFRSQAAPKEIIINNLEALHRLGENSSFNTLVSQGQRFHMEFAEDFEQVIQPGMIPEGVTHVTFGEDFNQPLTQGMLPNSLTHLNFDWAFNQHLPVGVIPANVTHLSFGRNFNQHLPVGAIPANVIHLSFGRNFNQHLPVRAIPANVIYLSFGQYFNKPLAKGVIPACVKHLIFGWSFNQELAKGVIPEGVTNVTTGYGFDTTKLNLPISLQVLNGSSYTPPGVIFA